MKVCRSQFNLYLVWLAAIMFVCGCQTNEKDKEKEKTKDAIGALRVHIESPRNLEGTGEAITLIRSNPVVLNIANDPVLTEASIIGAHLVDTPGGGYAVVIKFDDAGTYTLEQFSAANPGRHFAIFGQWGKKLTNGRWLSAPLITQRITNGELIFTPDATREETKDLVDGLANTATKNRKAN
jgi:preprotein translocase subunit SecD